MDFNTVELPGRAEAVMINDLAVADVHSSNASHLFLCQFKIKDVQIFGHPFLVDRLWDGGDIPLEVPAKHDLGRGLAMLLRNLGQGSVVEDVLLCLGKRLTMGLIS